MNAKTPTPPEATKKRATPQPTDETQAIRALRDLRKLDARIAKAESEAADLKAERSGYMSALSDETKRILAVLQGVK